MKSLVVGFGSIGKLHAKILSEINLEVEIVTNQNNLEYKSYENLEEAIEISKPEYIVISNKTVDHHSTLLRILKSKYFGKILIEKPIFSDLKEIDNVTNQEIYVGYNLRFHPVLLELKKLLKAEKIISANIYVGEHLSNWRKEIDYRKSYSAKRSEGGGVLRDLSHEIDYALWLFGNWQKVTAKGGHLSNLEIDSEDLFSILIQSELCPVVNIQMSYLDRVKKRTLLINTETDTFEADLIKNKIIKNGDCIFNSSQEYSTYRKMHESIISIRNKSSLCTYQEGINVIELVEFIERSNGTKWIDNE